MTAGTVSAPVVDAQVSIDGIEWCFAKFQNGSYTEIIRNDDIICGHVDPEEKEGVPGREINLFKLWLDPTLPFLRTILEALGTTESPTDTFTSDLTDTTVAVLVDLGGAVHKWSVSWLQEFVLRGQVSNVPVSVELTFIGQQEEEEGSPTFTPGTSDFLFGFPGSIHTIAGTPVSIDRFALKISRNIVPEWNNDIYVTGVGLGPRQTLFATTVPYIAGTKNLYWNNKRTTTKSAVTLKLLNGVRSLLFTMPNAELNARSPSVDSAQQTIRLPMQWEANRRVTATAAPAFTFVLDDTP
jgi:hypothetical protein